jgi:putative membrane protein
VASLRYGFCTTVTSSLIFLSSLLVATTVFAQQTNDPAANSGDQAGRSATGKTSNIADPDKKFMQDAARAGRAEVEAGKLASSKGSNDAVKKFGQQMAADHGKNNDELSQIAKSKGVTLPDAPDAAHQRALKKLQSASGSDFDASYSKQAGIKDHEAAKKLFSNEAKNGRDADLKAFAQKTLPTIDHHLEMARALPGAK